MYNGRMGCLYMIDFPNGKSYVGITTMTAARRLESHFYEIKRYGSKKVVGRALTKYAGQFVVTELVYSDDWRVLCDLEKKYIAHYSTKIPHGYNMTDGGDGSKGLRWNEEQRAQASARLVGNKFAAGCKHTPEGLEKLRQVMYGNTRALGHKHTAEFIEKMRTRQLGNTNAKPKTLAHKARIGAAQALRRARERGVPFSIL